MPSLTLLGQSILSGIFIGALYGLFGLGLSLSWGMLRQINLAHFALAFLGSHFIGDRPLIQRMIATEVEELERVYALDSPSV